VSTPEVQPKRSDRQQALVLVGAMVLVMWVLEVVDQVFSGADLDQYGIRPHDAPDGLLGIFSAPFLHAGFGHLTGNTVPFLVLGAAIALSGFARVAAATAIIVIAGGLGVWLFAPAGTDHIGASGVVFGYAGYLIARGFFSKNMLHFGVGIGVIAIYGTTLLFGLAPQDGISWQGHLFGGLAGVLAAWLLDSKRREPASGGASTAAGAP
jgi:membrane associated rhomboid family serine protease